MSRYLRDLRAKVGTQLLELPSVSVILRDADGRVLLVRQSDVPVWSTPGGAIEPLETPADAAVRETWEETGLHVRLTRLVGVFGGAEFVIEYSNGDRNSYAMVVFEAERIGGKLNAVTDETRDAKFFGAEDLATQDVPGWLAEVLAATLAPGDGAAFRPPTWTPPSGA